MPNKKNNKRQTSAAVILSQSSTVGELDVTKTLVEKTPQEQIDTLCHVIKSMQELIKGLQNGFMEYTASTKDQLKVMAKMQDTIDFLKAQYVEITGKMSMNTKEIRELKREMVQLKTENRDLRIELQNSKSNLATTNRELRTLKDEFLLNLERQTDNSLVVHGISESDTESETDLKKEVDRILASSLETPIRCLEAFRVGKKGTKPRVIKARWECQKHCKTILENYKKYPAGIYFNKDRPFILREIRRKIRAKAKELWEKNIKYEFKDLGLIIDGKFHHHSEFGLA